MSTPHDAPRLAEVGFDELQFSPTAWLYEGGKRAGTNISMFIVRQQPGNFVHLHTHPYPETFLVISGRGRWTAGDHVAELGADQMIAVPPHTLHGFRNIGDEPLHVVSVHESGTLDQEFTDTEPA